MADSPHRSGTCSGVAGWNSDRAGHRAIASGSGNGRSSVMFTGGPDNFRVVRAAQPQEEPGRVRPTREAWFLTNLLVASGLPVADGQETSLSPHDHSSPA